MAEQERDENGRFASGGETASAKASRLTGEGGQYSHHSLDGAKALRDDANAKTQAAARADIAVLRGKSAKTHQAAANAHGDAATAHRLASEANTGNDESIQAEHAAAADKHESKMKEHARAANDLPWPKIKAWASKKVG